MFWPNVDHDQHVAELRLGLRQDGTVSWLDEEPFSWQQEYAGRTSILRTVACAEDCEVEITDLAIPDEPILLRRVRCSPPSGARSLVLICRPSLDGSSTAGGAYVDPDTGALLFYRRGALLAVAVVPWQEGRPGRARGEIRSLAETDDGRTDGTVAHRAPVEGLLCADIGDEVVVLAAFAPTPAEALSLLEERAQAPFQATRVERCKHDRRCLARAHRPARRLPGIAELYDRSLLTLALLTDAHTGATIAAPEFDPSFVHCGGYGFVWPRDLVYVVLALLAAGRDTMAASALRWLARHQAPEGLWLQRYWTDGSLAPSWSLHQIDETGAVLFAYEAAWRELEDHDLDRELWPSARAAAEFLSRFLDPDTGLPLPSVDLWEKRDGQHSYSAAAVYGGLAAAAAMALRHEPKRAGRYAEAAARVRSGSRSTCGASRRDATCARAGWDVATTGAARFLGSSSATFPTRTERCEAPILSTPGWIAPSLGLPGRFARWIPLRHGCGPPWLPSSAGSSCPTAASSATRGTATRAATPGSSSPFGWASTTARSATERAGAAAWSTPWPGRHRLGSCPSRSPPMAVRRGWCLSPGATRSSSWP